MAKSATTFTIRWNFNHHISNRGGTLTTTYHIQGAGAPAKTKNYVNADGVYIFSGKGPTFSASCKTNEQNLEQILERMKKAMVQIKRDWFDTEFENYERGKTYGRWKEKIQV